MNDNLFICQICSKKVKNLNGLTQHIRKIHKLKTKDYYDKYIKTDEKEFARVVVLSQNLINLDIEDFVQKDVMGCILYNKLRKI